MFAAVVTLLVLFGECSSAPMECGGANETLSECASACQPTCAVQQPAVCTLQCVRGCVCATGFIRDESSGRCVAETDCPQESCDETEQFLECGSACPVTCESIGQPAGVCTAQCVAACFCTNGLVRDSLSGKCVEPAQCPKDEECGENEEFVECGSACPDDCDSVGKERVCTLQCVSGCACKYGFVRESTTGRCIAPSDCPQQLCGEDEQLDECGSACPLTCDEPEPRPCTRECVRGCFCKDGLLRDGTGGCVPASDCPAFISCAGVGVGRMFEDPSAACSPEFYVCSEASAQLGRAVKLSCPQGLFFNAETLHCDPFAHVISCMGDHVMAPDERAKLGTGLQLVIIDLGRGASCFPNCLVIMHGSIPSCLYVCQIG